MTVTWNTTGYETPKKSMIKKLNDDFSKRMRGAALAEELVVLRVVRAETDDSMRSQVRINNFPPSFPDTQWWWFSNKQTTGSL